jgi:hypothetical protein
MGAFRLNIAYYAIEEKEQPEQNGANLNVNTCVGDLRSRNIEGSDSMDVIRLIFGVFIFEKRRKSTSASNTSSGNGECWRAVSLYTNQLW